MRVVFNNGKQNKARNGDAMTLQHRELGLVYIDPPYYSPLSDNEYVRRYHFVEGLARDWQGVEIQEHTITKKFQVVPHAVFRHARAQRKPLICSLSGSESVLVVSYSSNSQPTLDEMVAIMAKHKSHVKVVPVDFVFHRQPREQGWR